MEKNDIDKSAKNSKVMQFNGEQKKTPSEQDGAKLTDGERRINFNIRSLEEMSKEIQQLRYASGLTLTAWAKKMERSVETIRSYEQGKREIPEDRLKRAKEIVKKIDKI